MRFSTPNILQKFIYGMWIVLQCIDLIRIMFPNEMHPQVIKGSPDGSYATFSLLEKSLSRQQLFSATYSALSLLQRFYPSCDNQIVHVIQLEEGDCGWFSYLHMDMKNILFIAAITNKMVLGSCGCAMNDQRRFEELKIAISSLKTSTLHEDAHC